MGRVIAAQEKRSLLPTGKAIRAVLWQRLNHLHPDEVDRLQLWQIGAMLGNHMVEKDATEREEADRIMAERAKKVFEVQERERKSR